MNCAEFQRALPDFIDLQHDAEGEAHLQSCPGCSSLMADLKAITEQAKLLQAGDEPSPRVWNSIEIELRKEGLIRPQRPELVVARPARRWGMAWLMPVAVLLVLGVVFWRERDTESNRLRQQATNASHTAVAQRAHMRFANLDDDQQLLDAVGSRSPALRATYAADLQHVNSYIRDAELSAEADPNDEEVQQLLMDAYEQRAMVYEMALDRSLP
ncbi:MAG TPA: hypothetical protein VLW84_14395 [Terriglobales bacterium]|nr:hypothetical protein [Terriglobales bacterium]